MNSAPKPRPTMATRIFLSDAMIAPLVLLKQADAKVEDSPAARRRQGAAVVGRDRRPAERYVKNGEFVLVYFKEAGHAKSLSAHGLSISRRFSGGLHEDRRHAHHLARRESGAGDCRQRLERPVPPTERLPRQGRPLGVLAEYLRAVPEHAPSRAVARRTVSATALRDTWRQPGRSPIRSTPVRAVGRFTLAVVARRPGRPDRRILARHRVADGLSHRPQGNHPLQERGGPQHG